MGLGDLVRCVELLKERIQSHGTALRENETRTRMALIDTLLQALGWNVSDPGVVTPEYRVAGGLADYALLRPDGRPVATVEAKKLGERMASHSMQMLNYANAAGIPYAGLTDGNHWELYDVFRRAPLEERRILEVSIADAPAHESALKLLLLWRPNLASGQPVPAGTPIVGETPRPTPTPDDVELPPMPQPVSADWVELSEYHPPGGTPCPTTIRFWDGSERPLKRWREILTSAVEKLYAEQRLTVKDVPIELGKTKYLVHTELIHPDGKRFEDYKSIEGTPLVVNVNLSAERIRKHTEKLLHRFGPKSATVYLQVA